MKIEVLYFDGCPSFPKAMDQVKRVLDEERVDAAIEAVAVETHEDALTHRFLGSPTIRVNGLDVEVEAREREDFGLKCRLYRIGQNLMGVPDTQLLKQAIRECQKERWSASDVQIFVGNGKIQSMSVIDLKRFQMNVRKNHNRCSIILKGDVNEKAAWKLLKKLEALQPSMYPIYLDIGAVGTIHWFAANILKSGFEHLLQSRGDILLMQKGKKPTPISDGNFSRLFLPAQRGHNEV